jgi:hypothetical protein
MVVYHHRLLYDLWSGPPIDANDKIASAAVQGGIQLDKINAWEMIRMLHEDFGPSFWNDVCES